MISHQDAKQAAAVLQHALISSSGSWRYLRDTSIQTLVEYVEQVDPYCLDRTLKALARYHDNIDNTAHIRLYHDGSGSLRVNYKDDYTKSYAVGGWGLALTDMPIVIERVLDTALAEKASADREKRKADLRQEEIWQELCCRQKQGAKNLTEFTTKELLELLGNKNGWKVPT
jgi:hypothetical protein